MSGRSDHDLLSRHGLISQYKQELGLPEPGAQAGHAQGSVALDWRQHVVGDDQRHPSGPALFSVARGARSFETNTPDVNRATG
jgi:hypothetical protein